MRGILGLIGSVVLLTLVTVNAKAMPYSYSFDGVASLIDHADRLGNGTDPYSVDFHGSFVWDTDAETLDYGGGITFPVSSFLFDLGGHVFYDDGLKAPTQWHFFDQSYTDSVIGGMGFETSLAGLFDENYWDEIWLYTYCDGSLMEDPFAVSSGIMTGTIGSWDFDGSEISFTGELNDWNVKQVSDVQPVPEPSTALLLGVGFAFLVALTRKRKNRNSGIAL